MANVDGDLVFLDARRDSYFCIARDHARELLVLFRSDAQLAPAGLLAELKAQDMVRHGPASPDPVTLCRVSPHADFHQLAAGDLPIRAGTIAALVTAGAVGLCAKSTPRVEQWLTRARIDSRGTSLTRTATLAMQFDRLRPWLPRSGGCLAGSIMLLAFLRWHGIEADWVFGVRTFPFEAHCWVEHEGVVLNDVVEHVAWFTPIAMS